MTNLRIIGFIIGIIGIISTFLIYRGARWKRANFFLFTLINLCIIIVSINPDAVNILRDVLLLHDAQFGRILALLISANLFLLFFVFYTKAKLENLRTQFDKLIRKLGLLELENTLDPLKIKPIMVIIPAYNEAENLGELLTQMPQSIDGLEVGVIVVNDGSADWTDSLVRQHGYLVATNLINRGQGAASRLGYDILTGKNVSIGITMDADNQHRPEDIEKLVKPILEDGYDLVIGSRILGQHEKESSFRNIGIGFFSKAISFIIGLKITDCSSGFKAFNVKKLNYIKLTEDQFQAAEVLIEARKKGLKICEVPIAIKRRKHGKSKKGRNLSYGFYFAKTVVKTWLR